jgi:hypothetical protein
MAAWAVSRPRAACKATIAPHRIRHGIDRFNVVKVNAEPIAAEMIQDKSGCNGPPEVLVDHPMDCISSTLTNDSPVAFIRPGTRPYQTAIGLQLQPVMNLLNSSCVHLCMFAKQKGNSYAVYA